MKRTKNNNPDVIVITGMQEKILRGLGDYKFLTVSQMVKLKYGIKNRVYESLKKLELAGYIKHADYKALLRYGNQLERIHYLSPKGANLIVTNTPNTHLDNIRFPKSSTTLFTHDYFHRVSSINTHISFNQWLQIHNFSPIVYQNYFDVVGSRKKHINEPMHAVTRIDFGNQHFLDPDAIAIYLNQNDYKITVIETYNGKDTKRVIEQLRKHIYAVKHGLVAHKYEIEAPTRVCCTFENEQALLAVLKRLKDDPYFQFIGVEHYFYFGVAQNVWSDFENSFVNLLGINTKMSNLQPVTNSTLYSNTVLQ